MISRQIIKQNAKNQLGNNIFSENWLMALLVFLISSAIIGAIGGLSVWAAGILGILVAGPLSVGIAFVFSKLIRIGGKIDIADMFNGFKDNLGRNMLLAFMTSLFTTLWSFLFLIPGIVKAYSYSMAFYIANDHPEYDWNTCIKESMRLTKGHKWDLFVLDLSFIGWAIIGYLCLGIGTLWVIPYVQCSKYNYYEAILGLNASSTAYTTYSVNDIPNE